MKKMIFLFLILLCMGMQLHSTNHMDLLTSMTGEHNGAMMGSSLASLDFNNDGYDDLVVCSHSWGWNQPPDSTICGKVYIYWGGPVFDNTPDMTFEGTYMYEYSGVFNLGDVNGDGIEDLGMAQHAYPTSLDPGNPKLTIFYGRQNPLTQPDYFFELDGTQYGGFDACTLGDINNDGFDDIGLLIVHGGTNLYRILLGGSMQNMDLFENGRHDYGSFYHELGDINNDGFNDFSIGFFASGNQHVTLYYGSSQFNVQNSLAIYLSPVFVLTSSCKTGDVNGDGFDDFIGYEGAGTLKFWFGSNNLTPQFDLELTPYLAGHNLDDGIRCGDVNNDGYSDIFGTYPTYDWNSGLAGLWLGGEDFNATLDLTFEPPSELIECNFGDVSTTGDFNGDGCCDYAIAAPFTEATWFPWNGKVYVYAGNEDLADTTVSNEDETNNVTVPDISIKVYPNPINNKTNLLGVTITSAKGFKSRKAKVEIYNLKGQKVLSRGLSLKEDNRFDVSKLTSGKYILRFLIDNNTYTKKLTIR